MLPALDAGGVEKGTIEVGRELVARGHRSIVISDGGRMLDQLLATGSEHLCWPVGEKRLSTIKWIWKVRRYLREQKPDILHLRSRLPAWIGYRAWKGLPENDRPHLVTTVHGFYTVGRYSAVMTKGERVIAVSNSVKDYILNNYTEVNPEVIRVIHRGVDIEKYPHGFKPSSEWMQRWDNECPQLQGRFVITLPARITRWKGQEDFVSIIGGLKSRGLPVAGLIVGEPHARKQAFADELKTKIKEAGLVEDIIFTGHRGDIREIMSISNVVLSLSKDPEAFGRTTIEALSLGVPVAGYEHGGVAEQLSEVYPQGLIQLGNVGEMINCLEKWYIEGAPAVPDEHPFTTMRMLDSTFGVYQELLAL